MAYDFQKAIEAATKDGVLDVLALKASIDTDYVNPIVAKQKPNMDKIKQDLQSEIEKEVFSSIGIEEITNKDSLKAYAKKMGASTDETKERLTTLEQELQDAKEYETKYNELVGDKSSLETKLLLKGEFSNKYMKHAVSEYNERYEEGKDPEEIVTAIKEEYAEWLPNFKTTKGNEFEGSGDANESEQEKFNKAFGITK